MFLLGAYLIVQSLAGLADSFGVALVISTGKEPLADAVTSVVVAALLRIAAVAILGIAPGALLMWKSGPWSEALFPATDASPSISLSTLVALGLLLLGTYFAVSGVALLVGGAALIGSSYDQAAGYGIREAGRGGTHVAAGIALILWSRRLDRNAT